MPLLELYSQIYHPAATVNIGSTDVSTYENVDGFVSSLPDDLADLTYVCIYATLPVEIWLRLIKCSLIIANTDSLK